MMQGHAFRCDQCKRTVFVPEVELGVMRAAPDGWFTVSQSVQSWPTFHFCQFQCLFDYVTASVEEPVPYVLLDDPPDSESEVVLSEWSPAREPVDEQAG